ncbi:MAG: GIY-YIG nuclease family protein [Methanomassiliicoccaceae archaeon]|jgi:Uri superfamily endonuclease|nr:GIY-YIG nuclease family protein [Methanomassiliicoccaceae archaeon]
MHKGTYLLFLEFRAQRTVDIGKLGTITVEEGEYCYVGSAMNGLGSRIRRHLSDKKKIHWHIDHLTTIADAMEAYVSLPPTDECELSRMAKESGGLEVFKGFGCSDCRCHTHLFLMNGASKPKLLNMSDTVPFLQGYE